MDQQVGATEPQQKPKLMREREKCFRSQSADGNWPDVCLGQGKCSMYLNIYLRFYIAATTGKFKYLD